MDKLREKASLHTINSKLNFLSITQSFGVIFDIRNTENRNEF